MDSIFVPPNADYFFEGFRQGGDYSFAKSIAEIVDNSITAGATKIDIDAQLGPISLAIIDNGSGMSRDDLITAMTVSSRSPTEVRAKQDLGRFGLGLKLASLAQCDVLKVISSKDGNISGFAWDLDYLRDNNWELIEIEDPEKNPHVEKLSGNGTIVLWEKIQFKDDSKDVIEVFNKNIDDSRNHLALTFHRFLHGESGIKKCSMLINGTKIEPSDPYNLYDDTMPHTIIDGPHTIGVSGESEYVIYTLPHQNSYENIEDFKRFQAPGGDGTYRTNQGFYIYRSKRLIRYGSWERLSSPNPLTQLCRVQVDIGNDVDAEWEVSINRTTVKFPPIVKKALEELVHRYQKSSRNTYTSRGTIINSNFNFNSWNAITKNKKKSYKINQENPLFKEFTDTLNKEQKIRFLNLVALLEDSIPKDAIFSDMASNPVAMDIESENDLLTIWAISYFDKALAEMKDEKQAFQYLEKLEIFVNQKEELKSILSKERNLEL
tara:strand:- start:1090 stop:2562 length:1473 start_codon:yes stop_codon:yes gene_type:complete